MAVDDSTIVELADMREFLNIPDGQTAMDSLLESLLDSFNDVIEDYLGVTCINTEYTETYDGDGTDTLFLKHYPIASVSSLSVDDETVSSDDYSIYKEEGFIRLDSSIFTKDNQNVSITYTAGHGATRVAVPNPLKLALKTWVARAYKAEYVDFAPEVGEEAARSIPFANIPWDIRIMLAPYKCGK